MTTSINREISCRVTRTLLMYVREQNKGSLGTLLDGLDLDEEYLLDSNNWVSHTFLHILYQRMIAILGDENAVYKMALASGRFQSLGLLDNLARLLGSPKLIYEQASKYNRMLKVNGDVHIHELGDSWVVLEDRYHKSAQKTRYDCDYTRGVLVGIPTIFDMPPADVEEIECQVAPHTYGKRIWPDTPTQGARGCLYQVRWEKRRKIPLTKRLFGRLAVYRKAIDDLQEANRRIQEKYDEVRRLASDLEIANRQLLDSKQQLESKAADLLASEERYRFLAENVSDIIWTLSLETMRFEYVSRSVESIRGFTAEEATQLSLEETLTPQSLENVRGALAEELAKEGQAGVDPDRHRTIELQQYRKDGSYVWAEAKMSFIRNEEGRPVGVLGVTRDITQRKRMEEELRRSRDELELRVQERTKELKHQAELLDLTHDAIVVRDLDGVIAFWNKAAEEMYGWTKEEAKGKIMRDLLQTQFPTPRDEIMAKIMQEGRWEGELTHTQKDGKKINVLSRWALQKGEEGRPTGVMHMNHDITQRLRAEEALREREEMFRLFLEHSPIYIFFKDEQIRSTQLSKNYEKMLGRPIHELIGKTMDDLFPSELAKSMIKDDLRILSEGKPIKVEEELNGRFYTTTKFPIIRQGKPPRLAGFTMDITEATLAEKALREQEERFRTIFNAVSDAIFVQDLTSGAILDVNQRMCDMYGYTREEALQLSIGTLCAGEPPYTEEHALEWIRKAAGGEPQVVEWRAKDKAGRLFWGEANLRRATIGGQDRLLVTLHDITEQKRAHAQILDQQRTLGMMKERELLARELHDGIGQMLAAAHLQAKSTEELLVRGDIASAESSLHCLAEVTQEGKESIRDYLLGVKARSSLEQGLFTVLRQYVNQYKHNYGIDTELVVPPELEEKRFDPTLEVQLQSIIQEALTNVRKHSGPSPARIIFALADGEIRVTVEDDGRGFDSGGISENQGFGIRAMRGRAEMVGGHVEVKSAPGKGTRVKIQVPCPKHHEISYRANGAEMERLRDKAGAFKVLLVEDATLFRQLLEKTLHARFPSIEIYQAGKVEEALQKVEVFLPDLIFMDIRLPDGNGIDLSKKIKSLFPNIIIIILTEYDLPKYREDLRQYADYFFSKESLNTENTLKLVQSILTRSG